MKKYKVGIIGYGGFGKFLHHWWNKLEQVEVVAIADSKLDPAELENGRVYRHWEELIAVPGLDIVSIVTPPLVHAEIAVAALKAGKHVLLEKPVAISEYQAKTIVQARDESGKVIMVNHMLRYDPLVATLSAISLGGSLGPLRHAEVVNYAQDGSLGKDHWFWNRDFSGGIFVEHGVHFIDIINSLTTQKPRTVSGLSHWRNETQEDQVAATVLYDGGLIAQHYHEFSGPGFFEETTIRLKFDLARIEVKGWIPMEGTVKAMVNSDALAALSALPQWKVEKANSLAGAEDQSRPEGWGDTVAASEQIAVSGIDYAVDQIIEGSFKLEGSKGVVYGKCVQDIMKDLIARIEDPNHITRVTLEDAIDSLKIALDAKVE